MLAPEIAEVNRIAIVEGRTDIEGILATRILEEDLDLKRIWELLPKGTALAKVIEELLPPSRV